MTRCEEVCSAAPVCEPCKCAACGTHRHASDCAVHNAPALPAGPCDCGATRRVVGAMDGWTAVVALDAELARVDRTMRRQHAED